MLKYKHRKTPISGNSPSTVLKWLEAGTISMHFWNSISPICAKHSGIKEVKGKVVPFFHSCSKLSESASKNIQNSIPWRTSRPPPLSTKWISIFPLKSVRTGRSSTNNTLSGTSTTKLSTRWTEILIRPKEPAALYRTGLYGFDLTLFP